jgi:formiminoglutamase
MNTNIEKQLSKRSADKFKIEKSSSSSAKNTILTSESDLGVIRNGGRRGANYGPKAILSAISKMTCHTKESISQIQIRKGSSSDSFESQQKIDIAILDNALKSSSKNFWHLGGGHDHIYPLLKSLSKNYKKICVVNIDAHLDTRIDKHPHSGTPFRQFSNEFDGDFTLYQLGIHKFANTKENYAQLKNGEMKVYSTTQIQRESSNFVNMNSFLEKELLIPKDHLCILSLDCDAIDSTTMEAVSAVNHDGLSLQTIKSIFSWYFSLRQEKNYIGVYEYNPIYDNLSNKGSRAIASLIEPFL